MLFAQGAVEPMPGIEPGLKVFVLDQGDIERAREAGGPLAALPDLSGVRDGMRVVVVEIHGRIVAYWCLFYALHAEPLHILESYRGHPGVIRGIVEGMLQDARRTGEPAAFSIITDPTVADYGRRLGFTPVEGTLWELPLKEI